MTAMRAVRRSLPDRCRASDPRQCPARWSRTTGTASVVLVRAISRNSSRLDGQIAICQPRSATRCAGVFQRLLGDVIAEGMREPDSADALCVELSEIGIRHRRRQHDGAARRVADLTDRIERDPQIGAMRGDMRDHRAFEPHDAQHLEEDREWGFRRGISALLRKRITRIGAHHMDVAVAWRPRAFEMTARWRSAHRDMVWSSVPHLSLRRNYYRYCEIYECAALMVNRLLRADRERHSRALSEPLRVRLAAIQARCTPVLNAAFFLQTVDMRYDIGRKFAHAAFAGRGKQRTQL